MATAKKYTKTAINTNLTLEPNINTSKDAKILKHYLKLFTVNLRQLPLRFSPLSP
jgi:hypothetical protein